MQTVLGGISKRNRTAIAVTKSYVAIVHFVFMFGEKTAVVSSTVSNREIKETNQAATLYQELLKFWNNKDTREAITHLRGDRLIFYGCRDKLSHG